LFVDYIAKNKDYFLRLGEQYMIGKPFNILPTIDSTNNHAMRMIRAGMSQHGEVYLALEQTAGKGQMGRSWNSENGKNLMLSVVLTEYLPPLDQQYALSVCAALACHDLFNAYAGEETSIKWPNDIFWRDRKAGGILIENFIHGGIWSHAIIGIGLNINQTAFPDVQRKAVSLKQITGKDHDPLNLARELCFLLGKRVKSLSGDGYPVMLEAYNKLLFKKGEQIRFSCNGQPHEGIVRDVEADGRLGILMNQTIHFRLGEIQWIL
jgi:BirA family biotin operon repressor/biotin-[acetyl-CoA-carboxylase] ligase